MSNAQKLCGYLKKYNQLFQGYTDSKEEKVNDNEDDNKDDIKNDNKEHIKSDEFSFGYRFWYGWDKKGVPQKVLDGHVDVSPKHKTLKQELLEGEKHRLNMKQWQLEYKKAKTAKK